MKTHIALLLSFLIPFITSLVVFITRKFPNLRETLQILFAFLGICFSLLLLIIKINNQDIFINIIKVSNLINISLYLDSLGILFSLLVNFLWLCAIIYSIGYMRKHHEKNQDRFYCFFSLAIGCTLGIAYSYNLYTMFIFYELLTLSTIPLVAHNLYSRDIKSINTYIFTLITTSMLFFLPAIILTSIYGGTTNFIADGIFVTKNVPTSIITIIILLFLFGIAKVGLMPFHKWLPSAMIAPTPVSALLHAVAVVKSGAFILIKVFLFIFGYKYLSDIFYKDGGINWLLIIPSISLLLASMIAIYQNNIKKLLAYSTIAQLSYIVLGCLLFSSYSMLGAVFQLIAHAFAKITLFFAAGSLIVNAEKNNVNELVGIASKLPITMIAFSIGALSIIGFPLTGGFITKWYLILGAIDKEQTFILFVLIASSLLNSIYFIPIIYKAFFLPYNGRNKNITSNIFMNSAMIITSICTIIITFYGDLITKILTI